MINDKNFFGDKFVLMRATIDLEPTLCNDTKHYSSIPYSDASIAKSYEDRYKCAVFTPQNNVKGKEDIIAFLQSKYKIHCLINYWEQISIPTYSAEIQAKNRSVDLNVGLKNGSSSSSR